MHTDETRMEETTAGSPGNPCLPIWWITGSLAKRVDAFHSDAFSVPPRIRDKWVTTERNPPTAGRRAARQPPLIHDSSVVEMDCSARKFFHAVARLFRGRRLKRTSRPPPSSAALVGSGTPV